MIQKEHVFQKETKRLSLQIQYTELYICIQRIKIHKRWKMTSFIHQICERWLSLDKRYWLETKAMNR